MQRDVKFIGSRLQELREKNHITIKELADDLEVPEEVIKYYEYGAKRPNTRNLALLAHFLGVPMEYFIEIVEQKNRDGFTLDHYAWQRSNLKASYVKRPAHSLDSSAASQPLDALHLSSRTRNALHRSGCETVQDACLIVESGQVVHIRNIGIASLEELISEIYKLTGADLRDCYANLYFPGMAEAEHADK